MKKLVLVLAVLFGAAAAGAIARLRTSSVPTTCAAPVTVNARTTRKAIERTRSGTPRAAATSVSTEAKNNGR